MKVKKYRNGGKVKKYRNGGKNGDPKKKKDFSADVEARKKKKKSTGWDEDRSRESYEKSQKGRRETVHPLLSDSARVSHSKFLKSEAQKEKEDTFRRSRTPVTQKSYGADYDARGEGTTKKELDEKYRDRRISEEQREKEKKERMKATEEATRKEGKKKHFADKKETETDEQFEARIKNRGVVKEYNRKVRHEAGTREFREHEDKYYKELENAKTPEEKQRVKDKYYSRKTQAKDKRAREYKLGGKVKALKKNKGKVKDKLKSLTKKKYKNGGKNGDPEKKKSRSSDVVATKGEYKGSMVDPRTGMPKGTSKPPSKKEARNAGRIESLRVKMEEVDRVKPFSPESDKIRKQISKLRGR